MSERQSTRRARLPVALLCFALLASAMAQLPAQLDSQPGQLPAIPEGLIDKDRLYGLQSIVVRRFAFHGNTVFTEQQLNAVVADYLDRTLGPDELEAAREALSAHYVQHGYLSSGALLPDQEVIDGTVRFDIVEGTVAAVEISAATGLREGYLRDRLEPPSPFRINDLRERIETLQRGRLVERIDASIEPGERPGEAVLRAHVAPTTHPYQLSARMSNHLSPNVGDWLFEVLAEHYNLLGFGDALNASVGFSRGVTEYSLGWSVPLNRYDTTLSLSMDRTNSSVISKPFNVLDIRSVLRQRRVAIEQPIVRRRDRDVAIAFALEVRRNQTSLLGMPFSFTPGATDGHTAVTVLQAEQSWTERGPARSLAFSSRFNFGMDWFNASDGEGVPNGRYFAWLGQAQWFERLSVLDSQLLTRANVQFANDALLPTEKFALGGFATVRGYRENQLLTDKALNLSLEWRIPAASLFADGTPADAMLRSIHLVPFFDYGRGWDNDTPTPQPDILASFGAGIMWQPSAHIEFTLFWGHRLRKAPHSGERDLQDHGIHFRFIANAF